jgi:hypothetical protein
LTGCGHLSEAETEEAAVATIETVAAVMAKTVMAAVAMIEVVAVTAKTEVATETAAAAVVMAKTAVMWWQTVMTEGTLVRK